MLSLETGLLKNGLPCPVPLSFAPTGKRNTQVIESLSIGDEIVLADVDDMHVAILNVEDILNYDKGHRHQHELCTTDRDHSGVDAIYRRMGEKLIGGHITLLNR